MLTAQLIDEAYVRIRDATRKTPLFRSEALERKLQVSFPIYLKAENLQHTGSFKVRGALNKLLGIQEEATRKGVITASAGNHAQGVAYHCQRLGIHAKILMPTTTPVVKVQSTKQWGAEVLLHGESYQEAYEEARRLQKKEGRLYIHAFDDEAIVAGQGTLGREILEGLPQIDLLIAPIGGGGLLAGMALYLKEKNPKTRVMGVQAEGCSTFLPSLKAGKPITLETVNTIAEGISAKRMGDLTFDLCRKLVDEPLTVNDEEISEGVLWVLENEKLFVEGCGGATIAALIKKPQIVQGPTVVVLSGGNLDVNLLARIIERGLVKAGRLVQIEATIPDVSGSLFRLIQVIADQKASIMQINHERVFSDIGLREVFTHIELETQGPDHVERLRKALKDKGLNVRFL